MKVFMLLIDFVVDRKLYHNANKKKFYCANTFTYLHIKICIYLMLVWCCKNTSAC